MILSVLGISVTDSLAKHVCNPPSFHGLLGVSVALPHPRTLQALVVSTVGTLLVG